MKRILSTQYETQLRTMKETCILIGDGAIDGPESDRQKTSYLSIMRLDLGL